MTGDRGETVFRASSYSLYFSPLSVTTILDACDKSSRQIKREAKRRCSERAGAASAADNHCLPSVCIFRAAACLLRAADGGETSQPCLFIGLGQRSLFLACHCIQPQSLCICFFLLPFFLLIKHLIRHRAGRVAAACRWGYGPLASILGCNTSLFLVGPPVKAQIGQDSARHQTAVDSQPKHTRAPAPRPSPLTEMTILLCFPAPVERLKCE